MSRGKRMHEIDNDPLLPECLKTPNLDHRLKQRVVDDIRRLRPNWWQEASKRYDEAFNHHGCYAGHQEFNKRFRRANLWLTKTIKQFT